VTVAYNCAYDLIQYKISQPTSLPEEVTYTQETQPPLYLNLEIGTHTSYSYSIAEMLTNNASDYCSISTYSLTKVVNIDTGVEVASSEYITFFTLHADTGQLNFQNID